MADRRVKLIIDVDGKDVDKTAESIRRLGYSVSTLKGGKLVLDTSDVDRAQRSVSNLGAAIGTALGSLAASAVSRLTYEFTSAVKSVLNYSSSLEQAKIGFETMTGSAEIAQQHLKDLQNFAKSTPFQFEELVLASQQLQGVGFSAKQIIPLLTDVGNALSAAGRMQDLPFAIKALGDIKAKGQLAGQEIIQLANAGIPIRQVLARDLKVTTAELIKMGEKGEISADQVFAALHRLSEERFGNAMEKQSKTFAGAMSNVTDALQVTAAQAFEPLYKRISSLAVDFSTAISKQQGDMQGVGRVIGTYIGIGMHDALVASAESIGGWIANEASTLYKRGQRQELPFQRGDITIEFLESLTGGPKWTKPVVDSRAFHKTENLWKDPSGFHAGDKNPVEALRDIKTTVDKIPSVPSKLDLDKAKKQAQVLLPAFGSMSSLLISSGNADWDSWFVQMGSRFHVDPNVLLLQALGESSFNQKALSPKGAQGFSQFMPDTAKRFGVDTSSIKDSIRGQAQYMGFLLSMFGGDYKKALAGYNAGEGNVQKYGGIPPFKETQNYVAKISSAYARKIRTKGDGGGYGSFDMDQALSRQSDDLTKDAREQLTRKALEAWRIMGLIPDGKMLSDFQNLLADDAKKQGAAQPTAGDIVNAFRANAAGRQQAIDVPQGTVSSAINLRPSLDEDYVSKFRESLGLEERMENLVMRERNHYAIITASLDDQEMSRREAIDNLTTQFEILQKRNLAEDAHVKQLDEQNQLIRNIGDLLIEIMNAGQNDGLIVYEAHLRDVLDYRNRELNAVIAVNRAQLELSHSMEISNNQIRAGVYEHLAAVGNINRGIADGINKTYDAVTSQLNKNLDLINSKAKGLLSFITEPLKAISDSRVSGIFTNLVDRIFPGLGTKLEKAKDPVVGELKDHTSLLRQIVSNTSGGGSAGVGGGGGLGSFFSKLFGGSSASGAGGPGGTPNFNPSDNNGADGFNAGLGNTGQMPGAPGSPGSGGNIFSAIKGLFSTGEGGLFAPRKNVLTGQDSKLAGILGGAGDIASLIGGFIGGRTGSVISAIGTGLSIGSMFGPWGAAIGAGVGLIVSLFGLNSARKKDEATRNQASLDAFSAINSQFDALISDIRLGADPSQAISRGTAIGSQVRSQYLQVANSLTDKKTRNIALADVSRVDSLIAQRMAELQDISTKAKGSADIAKRILPEFAGGHYFADYFRPNGLIPGIFDGRDDMLAMLTRGEMVINPDQQNTVRRAAGFDVFAGAGIPNYPRANPSAQLAVGGIASGSLAFQTAPPNIIVQNNYTMIAEDTTFGDKAKIYIQSDDGSRVLVNIIKQKKRSGDLN